MKTVRVDVQELLSHLSVNREKHIKEFDETIKNYRIALVDVLQKLYEDAQQNKDINHTIDLVKPRSFLHSYDQTIAKLQWTTEKEVELDSAEFIQFVLDEWNWKDIFKGTENFYNELNIKK